MQDVLIAGAGPAGLFLALQLAESGRSVRLVEARAAQSEHSKALLLTSRTMETFRIAGIAAPFETAAHRITRATVLTRQRILGSLPLEAKQSWYDYLAIVPQHVTERILLDAFVAAGGAVDYGTQLVGLVDSPDGVNVRLATPHGDERAQARFVVGCDGASSTVRRLIGFDFEGDAPAGAVVVADVDMVGDVPADELTLCFHEAGSLAIVPITAKRRRIVASVAADSEDALTVDFANELIAERGPWNLGATRLHWAARIAAGSRLSPGMQKGSIFLAGDASHVYTPVTGAGINAALLDAFNLAWKLDYVLAGFSTSGLLPSYALERHRAVKHFMRAADIGTRVIESKSPVVRGLRDWAMPNLLESRRFQRSFVAQFCGLDTNYGESPIVEGAGRRANDELVRTDERERRLYDVLDRRYLLVYPASSPVSVAEAFRNFTQHYGGAVVAISSDEGGLPFVRLVRPDGYVALETAAGDDPTPALERLSRVLATHVRRVGRAS
jgi:2-polyprenyl-6-methoxyphenol hydroxylase-like FAD-dependent oxidoreductase